MPPTNIAAAARAIPTPAPAVPTTLQQPQQANNPTDTFLAAKLEQLLPRTALELCQHLLNPGISVPHKGHSNRQQHHSLFLLSPTSSSQQLAARRHLRCCHRGLRPRASRPGQLQAGRCSAACLPICSLALLGSGHTLCILICCIQPNLAVCWHLEGRRVHADCTEPIPGGSCSCTAAVLGSLLLLVRPHHPDGAAAVTTLATPTKQTECSFKPRASLQQHILSVTHVSDVASRTRTPQ